MSQEGEFAPAARLARAVDRRDALRLLYAAPPPGESPEAEAFLDGLLQASDDGALNLAGLHVAGESPRLDGVLLAMHQAGRTIAAWPPRVADEAKGERRRIVALLLDALAQFARDQDARLTYTLLKREDRWLRPSLDAAGFQRLTALRLGRCRFPPGILPEHSSSPPGREDGVVIRPFDARDRGPVRRLLEQTYVGSLDCPEMAGLRTIDEIDEGLKAASQEVAGGWQVAWRNNEAVGVVVLGTTAEPLTDELSYLGVVPDARRQGIGRRLLRSALHLARHRNAQVVMIAVDARNEPALQLYRSEGFRFFTRAEVYLRVTSP